MIQVEIVNRQSLLRLNRVSLRRLVRFVLHAESVPQALISLAIVDDQEIQRVHREFMGLDTPTDVITFPLSEPGEPLVGDIVASAQHAVQNAPRFDNEPWDELCLYVIHGLLHLVGYDDTRPAQARRMASRQDALLLQWKEQSSIRGSTAKES